MVLVISCSEDDSGFNPKTTLGDSQVSIRTSTWKDGMSSAYTIIFDDFCDDGTQGIQDYADTMAYNRDIPIGFGIITSVCDSQEWQRAREMLSNGHEAVNHTHNHKCGIYASWCTDTWGPEDFSVEIDGSSQLIEDQLGVRPTFFIFPFDLATDTMLSYIDQIGYYGSRTGDKLMLNDAWFKDPFGLNYDVNFPEADKEENQRWTLNELLDATVESGGYGIREVHGVDDQSWGVVSQPELAVHFNYITQLRDQGLLWVANPSEAIAYRFAREYCTYTVSQEDDHYSLQFDEHALCSKYPTEITLELTTQLNTLVVWQDNQELTQKIKTLDNSKVLVNVRTDLGPVHFGFIIQEQ